MTDYKRFCAYCTGKSFALIGAGVSNLPLIPFLLKAGACRVTVRDLRLSPESPEALDAYRNGGEVILGERYLEDLSEDVIIRSPGIRPDKTEFVVAEKKSSRITCETELFLEFCTAKTYGVTGSDGKTTTTTLIARMLEAGGKKVLLGGNIGKSMLPQLTQTNEKGVCAVMELSSFQLMNCRFSPDVAVITNLAENHLDWHRSFREYVDAKMNITCHQKTDRNSLTVLNFDDPHSLKSGGAITRYFSCREQEFPSDTSVYYKNGAIRVRKNGRDERLLDCSLIRIPGMHNVQNFMAAIAAVMDDVPRRAILETALTFSGVEHRMEIVRELNGVVYYNSSIDSSPSRTKAALSAFTEKVIMIAGGYDKNLHYEELGEVICQHVKALFLCGATAKKIEDAVISAPSYQVGFPEIIHCFTLEKCVEMAHDIAESGDKVILTPASASFDQFKNFEERGKAFKRMVMAL